MAEEFDSMASISREAAALAKERERQQGQQRETERNPTYYQKQREASGDSSWSGGSAGGGVWAGRDRHR